MKILIVEDDTQLALTITRLIERWGHQVDTAANGEDAVRKVREKNFDLILLDVYLPDTDAIQLIPRLKKVHPKQKIIAMTGYGTVELEKEIRKLGVIHYICKPIKSNELEKLLNHIQNFFHLDTNRSK